MSSPAAHQERGGTAITLHKAILGPRAPFERMLVGSVATEQGADAHALGLELATLCDARLLLVSVIEATWLERLGDQSGPAVIQHDEHEHAATALKQAAHRLAQALGGQRVEQRLEISSSPARGLHDTAISEHVDLIVIGSSHRGPIGRVLLGSVGERLLASAPCAVAVAPRGHASNQPRSPGRILAAFDGSPEARLALGAAHTLATRAGATLAVVTVVVPSAPGVAVGGALAGSGLDVVIPAAGSERLQAIQLADALKRQENASWARLQTATAELDDPAIERQVLIGPDPATVILDAARDGADLLVLGSRAYGPLRRALLGSVSTQIIRHAPCPVLIMPRGSDPDRTRAA